MAHGVPLRQPGLHAPGEGGLHLKGRQKDGLPGIRGQAAVEGLMERGDEAEDLENSMTTMMSQSGNESSSSSGETSKDNKQSKPTTRSKGVMKKKASKNPDKGKEGTADDIPIPRKMDACRKEREPGGHPTIRVGAGSRTDGSASKLARSAGDFGTPQNMERQAHFAAAYRLSVSRIFLSLGLSDKIVDAIVDEQGYNTPHALNRLDKKGVEQLVSVIRKPGGMKDGTRNPGINVPL